MATYNVRILPFINLNTYVTSIFWEDRGGRPHRGVDLATANSVGNAPLFSMCEGTVIYIGYDATGFGNYLIMKDSTTNIGFLYAHLRDIPLVHLGDRVHVGSLVGYEGMTGSATGIHLHLEMQDLTNRNWIYQGSRSDYINPAEWIGYPEAIGNILFYDGTPIYPTIKKHKFKWVLYARKLRT